MTGSIERISLGVDSEGASKETINLHLERYEFAAQFAKDAHVLDIACGTGYGSDLLSKTGNARSIVGIDISQAAIKEAKERYAGENVEFFQMPYQKLAAAEAGTRLANHLNESFDLIVSLETIEHLPDPDDFLKNVLGFLKPNGVFVGSVPVTPSMDANPYHLQDFTSRSFGALLKRHSLEPINGFTQVHKFNPIKVKKEMNNSKRNGLRKNTLGYYRDHPDKFALRIWSTIRHGFSNRYDIKAARKSPQTSSLSK